MNNQTKTVLLLIAILVGGLAAFTFPGFAYWLSHDGFPVIFLLIGVVAIVDCGFRIYEESRFNSMAKGSLFIGIGSLGLAGGYLIGQVIPILGAVVILGSVLPWIYGLMLQNRARGDVRHDHG